MNKIETFNENQSKDGVCPVCPHCELEYPDASYGEIKNYPEDGMVAVFMYCEHCATEAEVLFEWDKRHNK